MRGPNPLLPCGSARLCDNNVSMEERDGPLCPLHNIWLHQLTRVQAYLQDLFEEEVDLPKIEHHLQVSLTVLGQRPGWWRSYDT